MLDDTRLFRRSDPDFPTTRAVQARLVAAGRVQGEGPLAHPACPCPASPAAAPAPRPGCPSPTAPPIPLGSSDAGTLHLDLNRLLAGAARSRGRPAPARAPRCGT